MELDDFGGFWLRTTSEGADTVEEVLADQIGSVLPHFNPAKAFKRVLVAIKFKLPCFELEYWLRSVSRLQGTS